MLKEGIFLGKRYEILERIGSGGMADVYKGKDHKLNRLVAVKVLKSDYRSDKVFIQKFLSEAQAAAGLMHPNIVNVYDVGQDRGLYYMVMELVEGITLKDYIEKKKRLSAKETISIAIQMVTGIQAAHSKHIVHRDIKPQNIMISKDGKVKVTDFGIARASTSSSTISANVMGSVHYTSPEQARGGVVDEKSDIYSAGITMYEMITGHVPFDGDSTVSVALKHLQEEIKSPSEEVPDIPYSLECIILKCTQKNTARRYQNCQELLNDLKRSMVSLGEDFARSPKRSSGGRETVVMSEQELGRAQKRKPRRPEDSYRRDTAYDPDEDYDEDYDDDDDYDDEDERGSRRGRGGTDKKDVDPDTKKIMKILMIVAGVIIAFLVLFLVGRAVGIFRTVPEGSLTNEEKKTVVVPNLINMTLDQAYDALDGTGLGIVVSERRASDKYESGKIIEQSIDANEKVKKNTQIEVVVSTGKEIKKVQVPDVIGETEDEAQRVLQDKGLIVKHEEEYSDTVEEGRVISTDPREGTEVDEGTAVTILVSMGAEKVPVPDLRGLSAQEAEAKLLEEGLGGSAAEEYSDDVAEGTVISQKQQPGTKVAKNTVIEYVISKGPEVEMIPVPRLIGRSEEDAKEALTLAGFEIGMITDGYDPVVTDGMVLSQTVSAGVEMPKGSAIGFTVNRAPGEPQTPDDPSGVNPDEGTVG